MSHIREENGGEEHPRVGSVLTHHLTPSSHVPSCSTTTTGAVQSGQLCHSSADGEALQWGTLGSQTPEDHQNDDFSHFVSPGARLL